MYDLSDMAWEIGRSFVKKTEFPSVPIDRCPVIWAEVLVLCFYGIKLEELVTDETDCLYVMFVVCIRSNSETLQCGLNNSRNTYSLTDTSLHLHLQIHLQVYTYI